MPPPKDISDVTGDIDCHTDASYRFGFDIGGTFTDLVVAGSDGTLHVGKCLTDARDITRSVLDGLLAMLRRHDIDPSRIHQTIAGATTAITNLIIERKGARTALITTRGFRDVIEIGREIRYDIYDLSASYPEPVIPRSLRREVTERIDCNGMVLTPLDEKDVEQVILDLKAESVEAIAVCFLHAFKNPAHELQVKEIAARLAPDIPISVSSEVLREIREYERTVATALNAYAMPAAKAYLSKIHNRLDEFGGNTVLRIMQSNGGIMDREFAEKLPLRMLESGPAAGALAASYVAQTANLENVLAFDMGGTTAKACLVTAGTPEITTEFETARVHRFKKGSGLPVRLPAIDLIEIGAGGGSIASLDQTSLLKVGPESAGADPGPACYDLGGEAPTVTDAALVLGYLDPEIPLSGAVRLRPDLAERAIKSHIADPLNLSMTEAAAGIHTIVCEHMASAAKVHAVEKGRDIRQYTMVAFGGAGPIHAREVARRAGCKAIVVPPHAGVFSALGLLIAPIKMDLVRTHYASFEDTDWADVEFLYAEMADEVAKAMERAGVARSSIVFRRTADMQYAGQGFDINVEVPYALNPTTEGEVLAQFERAYARQFGNHLANRRVVIVNWRLKAEVGSFCPDVLSAGMSDGHTQRTDRQVYFPELGDFVPVPVIGDADIEIGKPITGPALIEQTSSTIVIGPQDRFQRDKDGNVHISIAHDLKST